MFSNKLLLLLALQLILILNEIRAQQIGKGVYKPEIANLYITVNARHGKLELSWRNFNDANGYIVLAEDYPIGGFQRKDSSKGVHWEYTAGQKHKTALYSVKPTDPRGQATTDVSYNKKLLEQSDFSTSCYGYYGYFVNANGAIQSAYCMKLYPTWMNDQRAHLGKFRLRELFIPGTHDSSTYHDHLSQIVLNSPLYKYTVTQDDSIRNQLLQGARYIDLRPAHYPGMIPPFWANHGFVMFHQLKTILDQVRDYALKTNEIIILDAHEFPKGFGNNGVHDKLVKFMKDSLSDVMADPAIGWGGTLEDIWARKRTVIVTYNEKYVTDKYPNVVWSPVQQMWGNVQDVAKLKEYLYGTHQGDGIPPYQPMIADMTQLTPTKSGVLSGKSPGLREMGDSVNRQLAQWYFDDLGPKAIIVAVDFLRGTSIVDVALYWNVKKVPRGQA